MGETGDKGKGTGRRERGGEGKRRRGGRAQGKVEGGGGGGEGLLLIAPRVSPSGTLSPVSGGGRGARRCGKIRFCSGASLVISFRPLTCRSVPAGDSFVSVGFLYLRVDIEARVGSLVFLQ